jgi:hypothetical protein
VHPSHRLSSLIVALAAYVLPPFVAEAGAGTGKVCVGDCGGDTDVTAAELVVGVGIALGSTPAGSCPTYGSDGAGTATVAELVEAVQNSIDGCFATDPRTATPTPTGVGSFTPSPSATPGSGPKITFLAVTRADGFRFPAVNEGRPQEVPIYERPLGSGFNLVVEAGTGPGGGVVGDATLDEGGIPDLQIQTTRQLGNGDPRVCDAAPPNAGGIPAIDPPRFDDSEVVATALNDFGCRFLDGRGLPRGRGCNEEGGCVAFSSGESGCVSEETRRQFCATVDSSMAFPLGDTLLTVRVRDLDGELGDPAQLIVRVLNE